MQRKAMQFDVLLVKRKMQIAMQGMQFNRVFHCPIIQVKVFVPENMFSVKMSNNLVGKVCPNRILI